MKRYAFSMCALVASLALVSVGGCQQEDPVEKAGKEIIESAQDAINKATEVGATLEEAAKKRAGQVNEGSE